MGEGAVGRCKGCRRRRKMRPRGLCAGCYRTRREEFPGAKWAGKEWTANASGRLAAVATGYGPGSAGKMAVMARRAEAGEGLFHPGDSGCVDWSGVVSLLSHKQLGK